MSKISKAMERARAEARQTSEIGAMGMAVGSPGGDNFEPTVGSKGRSATRVAALSPEALAQGKVFGADHSTMPSNHLKILRTQVLKRLADKNGNSLLITSANPGEGKTFTAVNLAVSLAQEINRTALLVDADLKNPRVHKVLGLEVSAGLSDYLRGKATIPEILVNPGIPKLTILPGGTCQSDSVELLGSARMGELVKELRGRYRDRFVIFDTTSLLTCAEPLIFANLVDGILLVVEAERTARKDFQRTLSLLDSSRVVGVVYNKAPSVH